MTTDEKVTVCTSYAIKIDPSIDDYFVLTPKDPDHWDMTKKVVRQNDGSDMLVFTALLKGSTLHAREFKNEDPKGGKSLL